MLVSNNDKRTTEEQRKERIEQEPRMTHPMAAHLSTVVSSMKKKHEEEEDMLVRHQINLCLLKESLILGCDSQ